MQRISQNFKKQILTGIILAMFSIFNFMSLQAKAMTEMTDEEMSETFIAGLAISKGEFIHSLEDAIKNAQNVEGQIEAQRLLDLLPKITDNLSFQAEVIKYFKGNGIPISYTIIFKGQTFEKGVVSYVPDYYEKIYIKDIRIGNGDSYGSVLIRGMDLSGTAVHITVNYDAVQPYNLK